MTLDQLTMFVAIVDTKTFSSAAKKLHISQPSISAAVKQLENELNLRLFDRSTYRPLLTSEGQEVYRQAKQMLALQNNLKQSAALMSAGEERSLSINLDIVSPLPDILKVIHNYFSLQKNCKLELSFCVLGSGFHKAVNNEVDLYIGPIFEEIEKHSKKFHSHYFMLPVISQKLINRLSTAKTEALLKTLPRVIMRENKENRDINESNDIYVEDYLIKKETILAGLGWGRLPLWNIETELKEKSLVDIREFFPAMKLRGDIFVVPKIANQGKHLKAILELLV